MNGVMSIQVRVLSAQATKQIRDLEKELASVRSEMNRASVASAGFPARTGVQAFTKWGNQVQWAGRQLQYNFTLPILLAGGAAAKFALDNEKAMTRVAKVYGDGSAAFNKLSQTELPALGRAFEALSNKFGIAQADAINIAADWAAAGASGLALAKSVDLTMKTMVLGEMNAVDATQALIAIQAQYGKSVDELAQIIDTLNMIENQTGISMEGLVQGFARAAGVARSAGVDYRHLGAMLAAMVPAAGSAAQAGNAIKTILSRVLAPTGDAADLMKKMGINVQSMAWQSQNGSQRLEALAKSFDKLSDAQKAGVSATLASRYQINRFDVLMRDIINTNGYYQKSLDSTADSTRNYNQRVRELNAVLNSNPQRLKQIWVILQNAMADVIQPMIPVILTLATELAKLVQWFNTLDPSVQKLSLTLLLVLAAIGPVARYVGAVSTLLGILHISLIRTAGSVGWFGKQLFQLAKGPFIQLGNTAGWIGGVFARMGSSLGGAARAVLGALQPLVALVAGPFRAGWGRAWGAIVGTFERYLGLIVFNIHAATSLVTRGSGSMFSILITNIKVGFTVLLRSLPSMMASLAASMRGLYMAVFATSSLGPALTRLQAYLYVFFVTTVPGVISRASTVVYGAALRLWILMSTALSASGPAFLRALSWYWLTVTGFITRMVTPIFTASVAAFGAIRTAFIASMVGLRRTLLMLPALMAWGMRVAAGAAASAFMVGMRAIPAIATATWQATLATVRALSALGPLLLAVFTNPWTYVIGAALGLLYAFRKDLAKLWQTIQRDAVSWFAPVVNFWDTAVGVIEKAFWRLPSSVRDAILTVVNIIASAAKQVYEWFSYLNPFAHHSPSLVEQVTAGMAVIKQQYAGVGNVGSIFSKAARDLAAYKSAISSLGPGPFADERSNVAKAFPKMLPLFDALVGDMGRLNGVLNVQAAAVARQQAVVDKWQKALDSANAALDREQAKLDVLQNKLDGLNKAYSDHKAAMEAYANAPLKGMGQMEDAIFANEMAQKKLRLEMLKWEQANGSIQDIQNNMAKLAGSMEQLRGEASSLRAAGAGSDVLGPINDQIAQMQQQYDAMGNTVQNSPIADMQKQLDDLQKQGEMLDLTKSINFDPLVREIDKLANSQKELSYGEIVKGIQDEQAAMAKLQPQIDAATVAVQNQQAAVDKAKAARDAISATYDAEDAKLKTLKDSYDQTESAIRDIEAALRDMGSTASQQISAMDAAAAKAKDAMKGAKQSTAAANFDAAAGGNFPDVGGVAKIGREGGLGDQSKAIDDWTKGITDDISKSFGKFDMFEPIKKWWKKAWGWITTNVGPILTDIGTKIKDGWNSLGGDFKNSGVAKGVSDAWNWIANASATVWAGIKHVIDLFKDDFKKIWDEIIKAGGKIWNELGPELVKFKDLFPGLKKLLGELWSSFKVVAGIVGGALLLAFKVITSILANTLGPAIDIIVGVVKALIGVFRGVVEVVVGLLTGDWALAWQGAKDIVVSIVKGIWDVLKGAVGVIWGIIKGLVMGVVNFFKWLWDVLVGHSIIPDTVNAIIDWFKSLPGKVWDATKSLVDKLVTIAKNAWNGFMDTATRIWNNVVTWLKGLPQATWNSIVAIKDKVVDVSSKAWNAFWDKAKTLWTNITTWLKGLAQSTWNSVIAIKDKLVDVAAKAWDAFWTRQKTGWTNVYNWLKGLPQGAWNGIIAIKDKLAEAGRQAFQALWDKGKAIIDGKNGFFTWISGIPGRIAKALGGVGGAVANAVKNSWNGAADWLNKNAIGALNKVTSKFGFTMPNLPHFAGGGVIPGRVSKKDNTIIAARTGEGVIVPELVKVMGGARGLNAANDAAKRGRIDQLREMGLGYADGGIIGKVTGLLQKGAGTALGTIFDLGAKGVRSVIPGKPFAEDYFAGNLNNAAKDARKWGDKQEATGNGVLPGIGYQYQVAALRKQFPNIIITSTDRPGAVTVSGNQSYHALGRAVDMDPQMKYFDWIRSTYGKNTKELIFSPAGGKQIKNGQDYMYTGAVRDTHFNHVHWAYDRGGVLRPGHTLAYNGTGKDEYTLTNADWATFSSVVSLMDSITQKSTVAGASGAATMARTGATLTALESRLRTAEARSTDITRGNGSGGATVVNINGDLVLPNISNGDDAEDFLNHLKRLGGA